REQPRRMYLQWRRAPAARLGCATPSLVKAITLLGGATGFYCPGRYLARHPRRASDSAQSLSRRPVSAEEDRDVGVHVSRRSKGGRELSFVAKIASSPEPVEFSAQRMWRPIGGAAALPWNQSEHDLLAFA